MKLNPDYITRELMGDFILLPSGETTLTFNGIVTLNEMGRTIYERLPQVENEEALVRALADEYEVDEAELRADVSEFLAQMREKHILLD